jgi:hypothetical protein
MVVRTALAVDGPRRALDPSAEMARDRLVA